MTDWVAQDPLLDIVSASQLSINPSTVIPRIHSEDLQEIRQYLRTQDEMEREAKELRNQKHVNATENDSIRQKKSSIRY